MSKPKITYIDTIGGENFHMRVEFLEQIGRFVANIVDRESLICRFFITPAEVAQLAEEMEKADNAKRITPIKTDGKGREWFLLEREDGSVSIYWTNDDSPGHYVAFDDLGLGED